MTSNGIRMERAIYFNSFLKMTEEDGLRRFRLGDFKEAPVQAVLEKYAYLLGEEYDVRL